MAGGHHGRAGHHAAALVGQGYPKDYAAVLTPYRLSMGETVMVTQHIYGFVKPRRVRVRKTNSGKGKL